MIRNILALMAGVFGLLTTLNAQTITVADRSSLQPIEGVAFRAGAVPELLTDARGRVDISSLRGEGSVSVAHFAFRTDTLSYTELSALTGPLLLSPLLLELDEFVLSANPWVQEGERVPDRITVVKPRDVAFQNPGTAADMLQQTGEVFMQKSQLGGGSPMIRGFAANRLLIVVDGVRMNNAIYRAGNLQNVLSADPNAIERVEVLHGPGAMTYGSDAIGGVMDFHLLRPRFSADSSLLVRGGAMARYASAANEAGGHFDIGLGGKKLAFVGSASVTRFDDLRMGSQGPDDYLRPWYSESINGVDSQVVNSDPEQQVGSGYDNMNFFGKLAYKPIEAVEIDANMYYSTTSDVPRYDRLIEERNGAPRSAVWYYGPQEWLMTSLQVKHTSAAGPWDHATLSVAYQDYSESRIDRNFGSSSLRTQSERVTGLWSNLDFEKELSGRTQLLYGAELVSNEVASAGRRTDTGTGALSTVNSRYPDGSTWSTGAVYIGTMHDATERLTVSAGARFNWSVLECVFDTVLFPYPATSASLNNNALTGNLGLTYRPEGDWKLSLDLSTGFRAPNIDDIGKVFDSEPGAVIVPDPDLEPEYANTMEAGIEKVVDQRVRLSGSAFYTLLDNAMVRRPFILSGQDSILYDGEPSRVDAIQNAAQATVFGFVLAADASLGHGFGLMVRYNWQDGVEQDDDNATDVPLRHAPPAFGKAGLNWSRERLRLDLYCQFSAGFDHDELAPSEQSKTPIYAKDGNGETYAPSWYTLNLKGSYQISKLLQVSGGVENITDQRYRPYSSGITAPGRNLILALRARF